MTGAGEIPSVALEGVSKRFGELLAVDGLSLDLARGEFFTLLGPSGCGKTTTLRMIAGFERPTSGEVRIEGEDVAQLPPHKRPTNTVFQSYALFPHLSVEDNVAFGLKRKGVAKGEIAGRVKAELERVGLAAEAKHVVHPRPDVGVGDALAAQPEGDVLEDRQMGEQGVVLEDRVHVPPVRRQPRHVLALELDESARGLLEAADHPQRRRLAAA